MGIVVAALSATDVGFGTNVGSAGGGAAAASRCDRISDPAPGRDGGGATLRSAIRNHAHFGLLCLDACDELCGDRLEVVSDALGGGRAR